jgi:hypothetical protein
MGGVEIAKYTFFEKISRIFWSIQKKAVPLHAFFALYARIRAETILIINKN